MPQSVRICASRPELLQQFYRLQEFRLSGRFCDAQLQCKDGSLFPAHQNVVALASEALAALINVACSKYNERCTFEVDVSAATMTVVLDFIYTGEAQIPVTQVCEVVKFAHMYGMSSLVENIAEIVPECLNPQLCASLLPLCAELELECLEVATQRFALDHFKDIIQTDIFSTWKSADFADMLRSDQLGVSCEEEVFLAIWHWHQADSSRVKETILLFDAVRWGLMATTNVATIQHHAGTWGLLGKELLRLLRKSKTLAFENSKKRKCYRHYWSDFGYSIPGGQLVAGGNGPGNHLDQLDSPRSFAVDDKEPASLIIGDCANNNRIVEWSLGSTSGRVLVGNGVPINGFSKINSFSKVRLDRSNRHLFIAEPTKISRIAAGAIQELDIPWIENTIKDVAVVPGSGLYILHDGGMRVSFVKNLEDTSTCSEVVHDRSMAGATNLLVTGDACIYVSDHNNHRIQCWSKGATTPITVAGGNGAGSAQNQLQHPRGVFVTPDRTIYVADHNNHRIVKWIAGSTSGCVVAGGFGIGHGQQNCTGPMDVVVDKYGAIYVLEYGGHRVSKWGPALSLKAALVLD